MRLLFRAVLCLFALTSVVACGSTSPAATVRASGTPSAFAIERGVHFVKARLVWDSSLPPTPAGPNLKASGEVLSASGAAVDGGVVNAYVLDGPPGHATYLAKSTRVHDGSFLLPFAVVGPGGDKIRLEFVMDGRVLASTVVNQSG